MVKKKKVLVIIALVLLSFVVIGIAYACSNIEDTNDATTIASSDNNLKEIKNIDDEDVVKTSDEEVLEEQEIVDENTSEEIETDNVENIETEDEETETVSNIQETTVSSNTQTKETTSSASSIVVETEEQSTAETVATENVETSNTQETTSIESTTQSEAYWCIDGGSHHVEGDGANDHGYYSTWDLAWSACQEYLKGLDSSCHYKVAQCWCGLFYFWVEQN